MYISYLVNVNPPIWCLSAQIHFDNSRTFISHCITLKKKKQKCETGSQYLHLISFRFAKYNKIILGDLCFPYPHHAFVNAFYHYTWYYLNFEFVISHIKAKLSWLYNTTAYLPSLLIIICNSQICILLLAKKNCVIQYRLVCNREMKTAHDHSKDNNF